MSQSQYSLAWESFKTNICSGFSALQQNGEFVDMTLAADGHFVKVHQVLIALSSTYLKNLISSAPCQHPVIFLNNVSHKVLCYLLEYIYTGEVLVPSESLGSFTDAANALHIKGLENIMSSNTDYQSPAIARSSVLSKDNSEMSLSAAMKRKATGDIEQVNLPLNARKVFIKPEGAHMSVNHSLDTGNNSQDYSTDLMDDSGAQNSDEDIKESFANVVGQPVDMDQVTGRIATENITVSETEVNEPNEEFSSLYAPSEERELTDENLNTTSDANTVIQKICERNLENSQSQDPTHSLHVSSFSKSPQITDVLIDSDHETTTSDELKDYCFFCKKPVSNFIEHYSTEHDNDSLNSSTFTPNPEENPTSDQSPVDMQRITNVSPVEEIINKILIHRKSTENKSFINESIDKTHETHNNKENKRKPDFCFFCEKQIQNFARHMFRNHSVESEVQKALSLSKKSPQRKKLLTALRKKGNYVLNTGTSIKPMKKTTHTLNDDYLPCPNCLGFYARKQLWRHRKTCTENNDETLTQADAQNFLVRHLNIDPELLDTVFPRMRADKLSLVAKKDALICAFGAQYLKTHRENNFVNVVARKMRELAKLLLELKKLKPEVKDLFSALKSENYDGMVAAVQNCAKYDKEKECYVSPTFAMNISTTIKQCCNIAVMESLKTQKELESAEIEADLKTLIQLIDANWKFDVSSQAADDLNLKKCNKITIVSLASDVNLLKEHITQTALNAIAKLQQTEFNVTAYTDLMETIFCRVLLLNRRRPGELQHLLLDTYQLTEDIQNENEEFGTAITLTEKVLVNSLKRVAIRGKRGRGVPVLFTKDVQEDIVHLINAREKYIEKNNPFLFAKPGCMTSIYGYKVIDKHAKLCKAKNPKAISSTSLRKYLATLTQIFNMTENDIEQLATFMDNTNAGQNKSYKLPDIYQTAKITKLLMLMDDGKADEYKGKSFDEIELNLEDELQGENIDTDELFERAADVEETINIINQTQSTDYDQRVENNKNTKPMSSLGYTTQSIKKKRNVPWTAHQKSIVLEHFKSHVRHCKPPKRAECEALKDLYPDLLSNKNWLKIKVFVQNTYKKINCVK